MTGAIFKSNYLIVPPAMAKSGQSQNLAADVLQVVEQLERHCLAPDGSFVSKSAYSELQLVGVVIPVFVLAL